MAKVLVIPDARLDIDRIKNGMSLAKEKKADLIVLLGNYFDAYESKDSDFDKSVEMWEYLKSIIRNNTNVVPLLGESEISYLGQGTTVKGYNKQFSNYIGLKLQNHFRFVPCFAVDGVLYSNCGVTTNWLRKHRIMLENELRFRLGKMCGAGLIESSILELKSWEPLFDGSYGNASCMRASVRDLLASNPPNVVQVVGNAMVKEITQTGRIWLANSEDKNQYLLVHNGEPQTIYWEK